MFKFFLLRFVKCPCYSTSISSTRNFSVWVFLPVPWRGNYMIFWDILFPGHSWIVLTYDSLLWRGGRGERHPTVTWVLCTTKSLLPNCNVAASTDNTLRNWDVILRDQNESWRINHPNATWKERARRKSLH